jgi:hypothetical protein
MRAKISLLLILLASGTAFAQARKPIRMPQVQTIGEGVVWRISDNKDAKGSFLPPWKEIKITNVFAFKKKPVVGEKVTVIPLDVDIAPLELRIVKAEKKENACNERLPAWWEIELEPIKQREFFEIAARPNRRQDYPFDVCLIYPAVKFAHQVRRDRLTKSMLPRGVSVNTVEGAIDLTNDGIPDVLMVKNCCDDPKKAVDECDYACGKTFKKIRNAWKLIDTSRPC